MTPKHHIVAGLKIALFGFCLGALGYAALFWFYSYTQSDLPGFAFLAMPLFFVGALAIFFGSLAVLRGLYRLAFLKRDPSNQA
ncbi:MAG: hypothetical protein ACTS1Z_01660 [Parasphingopyxis sp.]|uniref:hypothetical protein n=1 Tax=Parasphingopyxis sp. TaxID=1920299 RepID=UPI003FA09B17